MDHAGLERVYRDQERDGDSLNRHRPIRRGFRCYAIYPCFISAGAATTNVDNDSCDDMISTSKNIDIVSRIALSDKADGKTVIRWFS